MYMERNVMKVKVGAIQPNVKPECVVAALVDGIRMEFEIVSSNRTKIANWWRYDLEVASWWGYDLEVYLTISEEDYGDLPRIIVCNEQT